MLRGKQRLDLLSVQLGKLEIFPPAHVEPQAIMSERSHLQPVRQEPIDELRQAEHLAGGHVFPHLRLDRVHAHAHV